MSNKKKRTGGMPPRKGPGTIWLLVLGVIVVAGAGLWWSSQPPKSSNTNQTSAEDVAPTTAPVDIAKVYSNALNFNTNDTNITIMEAAHSIMVTHILDFGDRVPSPGEAIQYIDRLSKPDDGVGRTFSILEAVAFTNKEAGGGSVSTTSTSTDQAATPTNAKPMLRMS